MSYTKIDLEVQDLPGVCAQLRLEDVRSLDALQASGVVVQLETGARVWVACVMQDDPRTFLVEFAVLAIALDAEGAALLRPSGVPLAVGFTVAISPDHVAARGEDAIRRDHMLLVLGEPPLGDVVAPPAQRVIRNHLIAYGQPGSTEDVL